MERYDENKDGKIGLKELSKYVDVWCTWLFTQNVYKLINNKETSDHL